MNSGCDSFLHHQNTMKGGGFRSKVWPVTLFTLWPREDGGPIKKEVSMRKLSKYHSVLGVISVLVGISFATISCSKDSSSPAVAKAVGAKTTFFDVTDEPGAWFDTGSKVAETRSLAIVGPGEKIKFLQKSSRFGPAGINGASRVESRHTVTSLIWPSNANKNELLDQPTANQDDHEVTLHTPGLHVFVCKVHPYMLAGVIVDDPSTKN